jgi:hypothetical protein
MDIQIFECSVSMSVFMPYPPLCPFMSSFCSHSMIMTMGFDMYEYRTRCTWTQKRDVRERGQGHAIGIQFKTFLGGLYPVSHEDFRLIGTVPKQCRW